MLDLILSHVNLDAVLGAVAGASAVLAVMGARKVLGLVKASSTVLDDKVVLAVVEALVEQGIVKESVLKKVRAELLPPEAPVVEVK